MSFDVTKRDAQATDVLPLSVEQFDFDAFSAYEHCLLKGLEEFQRAESGVAVYRRVRAAEVFADGSRDMKRSLELQLGCLQKSMAYKADIPNFLEPWYGIGAIAAAYGADYVWNPGQAPAVHPRFTTTAEALQYMPTPIAQTAVGRHTLEMIDYFLTQTKGRLPMSYSDAQSPLNASTMIVENSSLFMDMLLEPDAVKQFLDQLATLTIDFVNEQKRLIGDCLASPGHGFASARCLEGYGQSDDNIVMLSNEQYIECALPAFARVGQAFGGPVFHSCGNWTPQLPAVQSIPGLRMVDGAFSSQTDPDPNPAAPIAEAFAGSGVIVNARIVGGPEVVERTVRELWKPGMKLVAVTYCDTPEEQREVYEMIHGICQ